MTEGIMIAISTMADMMDEGTICTIIDIEKMGMKEGPKLKKGEINEELLRWVTNLLTLPSIQSLEKK